MDSYTQTRTIQQLMQQMRDDVISPRPEFQRKLVWSNQHKSAFIDSVLNKYPLPEIFLTELQVDLQSGMRAEMLVDGQQRLSTLFEYVTNNLDLKLSSSTPSFRELSDSQKRDFLNHQIVVRMLQTDNFESIREIFTRINSTKYALNAMEINHARYDGVLKNFAQKISENRFFEHHRIFSPSDIRRMNDLRYTLELLITMMTGYFNRDEKVEDFLSMYNDEFSKESELESRLHNVFQLIDICDFPDESRIWKKADFFTAVIELDRAININHNHLDSIQLSSALNDFYAKVDAENKEGAIKDYYLASLQGTTSRSNRNKRATIFREIIGLKGN
ncbi:DUF262 domain-containing protein [Vibrio parahaemolyticus]|uniref:DUF262 domain-containing protein n=1 Tax=Vibrio parahaemolyticus TaxID=670 RepID=UPI003892B47D|nr:DUF262 domain-containing protein [Vibrio parahaemolyticus]MCF9447863.1 DUF262 domain-containing protein [Vibrio parahaemolyticus]